MEKLFAKISLLFLIAGSILLIIGLSTPYWISSKGHFRGLWVYCYYQLHSEGSRTCFKLDTRPDFADTVGWIQTVRVLEICACVFAVANVIVMLCYLKKSDGRSNLRRMKAIWLLCVISALLCLVGIIIFGVKKDQGYGGTGKEFGWSFILTAAGGALLFVQTIPLTFEIIRSRRLGIYESI